MKTGRLLLWGKKKFKKLKKKRYFSSANVLLSNTNLERSKPRITLLFLHVNGAPAGRCWSRPRPLWEYPESVFSTAVRAAVINYSWYCCRRWHARSLHGRTLTRAFSPSVTGGSVMSQSLNQPLFLGRYVMTDNIFEQIAGLLVYHKGLQSETS